MAPRPFFQRRNNRGSIRDVLREYGGLNPGDLFTVLLGLTHNGGKGANSVPGHYSLAFGDFEMVAFDYKYLSVNELQVKTKEDRKTGRQVADHIAIHDEPNQISDRFWHSLMARFGFGKGIFNYFDYSEVFERISARNSNDRLRVCVEKDDKGGNKLLGVSNPNSPVVLHDELMEMLEKYEGENVRYHDGIIESTHVPRVTNNFDVGGDMFSNRFTMSVPIDGYGQPSTYLSLLRQVCSNGMIGLAPAFRTTLALGKGNNADVRYTIARTLDSFNHDEGFACLRQRMEAATQSWLSVNEQLTLYKTLVQLHNNGEVEVSDKTLSETPDIAKWAGGESKTSPLVRSFNNMTGDVTELYGLANMDALSIKRQRTLPVRCSVYDAINFATEVSTHYAKPSGARRLNGWVGTLISDEYDMENTKDQFADFADFHVTSKLSTPELTGSK